MGVLRRVRVNRSAGRRTLVRAGLGVVAVVTLVACEGGGINTGAVAFTTDQMGTKELERHGVDVQWLTCTASYGDSDGSGDGGDGGDKKRSASASASVDTVANVDCEGEDKKGRDITITGKVTKEVNGKCVRGDLTAKVDGKQRFHVDVLGNCNAPDPTPGTPDLPGRPGPTATVTVTQTIWCQKDPQCWPEGK
ncbi:hypothetical protein ACIQVC_22180 [Streptomyces sp. NPDC101112]|uniref:hypothetical protein n=1 Tax=unclassified Streptomyces TaxID=2593676 RepID=UPI00211DFAEF|nr:hypothetical protein [Streptomyces sp. JV178]